MNKRRFGGQGEAEARAFLEGKGAKVLEMNYRRPTGEIDLVARLRGTIVFVEVKRRSSLRYGRPAEAVDRAKQGHILRTAALYMQEKGLDDAPVRFDVIEVLPDGIRHIENAFDATGMLER